MKGGSRRETGRLTSLTHRAHKEALLRDHRLEGEIELELLAQCRKSQMF